MQTQLDDVSPGDIVDDGKPAGAKLGASVPPRHADQDSSHLHGAKHVKQPLPRASLPVIIVIVQLVQPVSQDVVSGLADFFRAEDPA